mgnify:CR=1 FL=1|jgi:hypothetical protein
MADINNEYTFCIYQPVYPLDNLILSICMLVSYQYAVTNFFCQKDYRELISGPIKFAIILFTGLFWFRFVVALVFMIQEHDTPRAVFDYIPESRFSLTIILN